ncbi:MAG: T9SS type A sorting domain-containing protein [Rhodothermales bacterium]
MAKTFIITIFVWLLIINSTVAQPVSKKAASGAYAIPYASESNRIELEVLNSTSHPLKDVSVQLGGTPAWITFGQTTNQIGVLGPGKPRIVVFTFDLDEKAPVGEVTDLRFDVSSATGQLESRTIKIEPEAPTELMLSGNFPNPFNPTTKIAYALPTDGNVRIEVFNSIGQRVARAVDAVQKAGYQDVSWNATQVPSGVYFYSVELRVEGTRKVKLGKMVVLK